MCAHESLSASICVLAMVQGASTCVLKMVQGAGHWALGTCARMERFQSVAITCRGPQGRSQVGMPSSPTLAVRLGRSAGRSSGLRSLAAACTWSHGRGGGPNEAITLEGLRRLESSVPRHYTWLSTWHWYCDTSYSFVVCVVVCAQLEFASDSLVNLECIPDFPISSKFQQVFSSFDSESSCRSTGIDVVKPASGARLPTLVPLGSC